jgi:hypothetical protein
MLPYSRKNATDAGSTPRDIRKGWFFVREAATAAGQV